jgi:hypothetical protein
MTSREAENERLYAAHVEDLGARFLRETGYLMPGASVPMAMNPGRQWNVDAAKAGEQWYAKVTREMINLYHERNGYLCDEPEPGEEPEVVECPWCKGNVEIVATADGRFQATCRWCHLSSPAAANKQLARDTWDALSAVMKHRICSGCKTTLKHHEGLCPRCARHGIPEAGYWPVRGQLWRGQIARSLAEHDEPRIAR